MFGEVSTRHGMLAKLNLAADVGSNHILWARFASCVSADCVAWGIQKGYSPDRVCEAAEYASLEFLDSFRRCRGYHVSYRAVRDRMIAALTRKVKSRSHCEVTEEIAIGKRDLQEDGQLNRVSHHGWWADPLRLLLLLADRMAVYLSLQDIRDQEWGWKKRFCEATLEVGAVQSNLNRNGLLTRLTKLDQELAAVWERQVVEGCEPRDDVERVFQAIATASSALTVASRPESAHDRNDWVAMTLSMELLKLKFDDSGESPLTSRLLKRIKGMLKAPKMIALWTSAGREFAQHLTMNESPVNADSGLVTWLRHVPREFDVERDPVDVVSKITEKRISVADFSDEVLFGGRETTEEREQEGQNNRRWIRNAMLDSVETRSPEWFVLVSIFSGSIRGNEFASIERFLQLMCESAMLPAPSKLSLEQLQRVSNRLRVWKQWCQNVAAAPDRNGHDWTLAWEIPQQLHTDFSQCDASIELVTDWLREEMEIPDSWMQVDSANGSTQTVIQSALTVEYLASLAVLMASLYRTRR